MKRKSELSQLLHTLPLEGEIHFQPPENIKLKYPCIIYKFDRYKDFYAGDGRHIVREAYTVTHIYKDPTQNLREAIRLLFTYADFDRVFVNDNLYHDVYTIYM